MKSTLFTVAKPKSFPASGEDVMCCSYIDWIWFPIIPIWSHAHITLLMNSQLDFFVKLMIVPNQSHVSLIVWVLSDIPTHSSLSPQT